MTLNPDTVDKIILLVLGGVGTGLMFVFKMLFERYFKKKDKLDSNGVRLKLEELGRKEEEIHIAEKNRMVSNNLSTLNSLKNIFGLMNETRANSNVDRFIIFNTHNGDGQPNYLKPYKVSVLQYNSETSGYIRRYQSLEVDEHYTKLLIKIQDNPHNSASLHLDEMPECMLKTIYQQEGVKYSEIHFLEATKTGIIYASLGTFKDNVKFDMPKDRYAVTMAVSMLRSIFEDENRRVSEDQSVRTEHEKLLQEIKIERRNLLKSSEEIL